MCSAGNASARLHLLWESAREPRSNCSFAESRGPARGSDALHPVGHRAQLVGIGHVVDSNYVAVGVQVDGEGGDDASGAAYDDARTTVDVDEFGCHVGDFDALVGALDRSGDPSGDV